MQAESRHPNSNTGLAGRSLASRIWCRAWGLPFYQPRLTRSGNPVRLRPLLGPFNQRLMESGVTTPWIVSAEACRQYWQSRSTDSRDGNNPMQYLSKDRRIGDYLAHFLGDYVAPDHAILELGSNCGVNLECLRQHGFHNLHGVEISPAAIELMEGAFPELSRIVHISQGSFEQVVPKLSTGHYPLVFTLDVAMHIHPESHDIFNHIGRLSGGYVCSIEAEVNNCCYVFARNYRRVYEPFGFREIKREDLNRNTTPSVPENYYGYTARLLGRDSSRS